MSKHLKSLPLKKYMFYSALFFGVSSCALLTPPAAKDDTKKITATDQGFTLDPKIHAYNEHLHQNTLIYTWKAAEPDGDSAAYELRFALSPELTNEMARRNVEVLGTRHTERHAGHKKKKQEMLKITFTGLLTQPYQCYADNEDYNAELKTASQVVALLKCMTENGGRMTHLDYNEEGKVKKADYHLHLVYPVASDSTADNDKLPITCGCDDLDQRLGQQVLQTLKNVGDGP